MHIFKKTLLLIGLFSSTMSFALPTQLIIFPHAEKATHSPHLSMQGIIDATNLKHFILASAQLKPDVIIANRTPNNRALGSIETCSLIANTLHLSLQTDFLESEYQKMIQTILTDSKYDNKKILVCWDKHDMASMKELIKTQNHVEATVLTPEGYATGDFYIFL
jgi:hypothetical protein